MRKLLVNALSVSNPSGHHVLLGHLDRIADSLQGRCRLVVICRADMSMLQAGLAGRAEWEFAPASTRRWWARIIWERLYLSRLVRKHRACAYFTPSGFAAHAIGIPQIIFAQNPWALVAAARRPRDAFKAWLQRRAYRRAMRVADGMVFLSHYMQQAYRKNAGIQERRGLVAYLGVDESAHASAVSQASLPRKPGQILSVSVMAPHKNMESLLQAFQLVHKSHPEARLYLVGSWPDPTYERQIRTQVDSLDLGMAVSFEGFVSREQLNRFYAESQVFCLMSRCESFGIPAIEAQLFGMPVVSSTICAIPEICGEGGHFLDPDDVPGIATALQSLIEDGNEWQRLSGLARENAARFTWEECSLPLVDLIAEYLDP